MTAIHQFIDRQSGKIINETFIGDKIIRSIYSQKRENPTVMADILASKSISSMLAWLLFDNTIMKDNRKILQNANTLNIDLGECVKSPADFRSYRELFERQIRYWETRPMSDEEHTAVVPCDSRLLIGSDSVSSMFFLKEKFFTLNDLLGTEKYLWTESFRGCDYALSRLTPDKYHYVHSPVSGEVLDIYEIDGKIHSCNPTAADSVRSIYSINRRYVIIIDTDTAEGTKCGLVALVAIAALAIGRFVYAYSSEKYNNPIIPCSGTKVAKGAPIGLFRPGSSAVITMFQKKRISFAEDIRANASRQDVQSRYTSDLRNRFVETDSKVRTPLGRTS